MSEPIIKCRDIHFHSLVTEPEMETVVILLQGIDGIFSCSLRSPLQVRVEYDLRCHSFASIEVSLQRLGYHLDNSLLCKLQRALYSYIEENERSAFGTEHSSSDLNHHVFVNRYEQLSHGCRDPRPEYWRDYL